MSRHRLVAVLHCLNTLYSKTIHDYFKQFHSLRILYQQEEKVKHILEGFQKAGYPTNNNTLSERFLTGSPL